MTEEILSVEHLSVTTETGDPLVHDMSMTLLRGHLHMLIGESGSGKSLTAKALIGALPKDLHSSMEALRYQGEQLQSTTSLLGRKIGYIDQDYTHSFNNHTRLDKQLVEIYRYHFQVSRQQAQRRVTQALKRVNLEPAIAHAYRFELSGGQLARIQIASVLMLNPEVIIADEPLASLDVLTGKAIMKLLTHLTATHGQTLLLITHDLSQAQQHSDMIDVMKAGQHVDHLTAEDVKQQRMTDYTYQLFAARKRLTKEQS